MSTGQNKKVLELLQKMSKTLKPQTKNENYVDYKAINEEKKKAFIKCKNGKNQFVFLTPEGADDPFSEWGIHMGLFESPNHFWSIDCDNHNKGESCLICNVIDSLRTQDKDANKPVYQPINKKIDVYAPVINVENESTIAEGPKWLKVSKTVLDQMITWLQNLEGDELPFYSESEPQRIIMTYDAANPVPKDKYKVDKKNNKPFPEEQLKLWKSQIKPLSYYMGTFIKTQDEIKSLIDKYLIRAEEKIKTASVPSEDNSTQEEADDLPFSNVEETEAKQSVESKLEKLKK